MPAHLQFNFPYSSDYRKVLRGRRLTGQHFDIRAFFPKSDGGSVRIHVAVNASRKIGNAVVRNRAKRRLRAMAREFLPRSRSALWLLVAKQPIATATFRELTSDMGATVARHNKRKI